MGQYLEFKPSSCKNCYRCLRECPVKAIKVVDQKAVIMEELCILCGKCTFVCHQNAKYVHGELEEVKRLLKKNKRVYVSVAPSFVSKLRNRGFRGDENRAQKTRLFRRGGNGAGRGCRHGKVRGAFE